MLLHLGADFVIDDRDIIGIFDLDTAAASPRTRAFLRACQQAGRVVDVSGDLPRSAVVVSSRAGKLLYISQLSGATLKKRLNGFYGM